MGSRWVVPVVIRPVSKLGMLLLLGGVSRRLKLRGVYDVVGRPRRKIFKAVANEEALLDEARSLAFPSPRCE